MNVLKDPPKLVRNRSPDRLQSVGAGTHGFTIGSDELMATHAQTGGRPSDITYVIRDGVQQGRLENLETGRLVRRKFSQKDVNDGKIVYVIDDHPTSTNDSFVFRVQDQHHNSLDDQRSVYCKRTGSRFDISLVKGPFIATQLNSTQLDVDTFTA